MFPRARFAAIIDIRGELVCSAISGFNDLVRPIDNCCIAVCRLLSVQPPPGPFCYHDDAGRQYSRFSHFDVLYRSRAYARALELFLAASLYHPYDGSTIILIRLGCHLGDHSATLQRRLCSVAGRPGALVDRSGVTSPITSGIY